MDRPSEQSRPDRPAMGATAATEPPTHTPRKRKNHRGGKKKRTTRRKSFAVTHDDMRQDDDSLPDPALSAARDDFYSLHGRSLSNTSIDSEDLLDHRYENLAFHRLQSQKLGG